MPTTSSGAGPAADHRGRPSCRPAPIRASPRSRTSRLSGGVVCTDADGDPLTYAIAAQPSHGSAVIDSAGRWTYTPSPNATGPDSFTVAADDTFATSTPATVVSHAREQARARPQRPGDRARDRADDDQRACRRPGRVRRVGAPHGSGSRAAADDHRRDPWNARHRHDLRRGGRLRPQGLPGRLGPVQLHGQRRVADQHRVRLDHDRAARATAASR